MCIIAVYKKGLTLDKGELKNCFRGNPDGAGLMYQTDGKGKVHIEKGFMKWDSFWDAAKTIPVDVDRVFHFRIATSGKISTACCHPFPICGDYKRMSLSRCDTNMGFAHNGVLDDFEPKGGIKSAYSDSMKFGKEVLFHLGNLLNERSVRDLIELYTTSRFAIMTPKETYLIGSWEQSRESGAFYSNTSYEGYRYLDCSGWDYFYEDYLECIFIENVPDNSEDKITESLEEQLGIFVYDEQDSKTKNGSKDITLFFDRPRDKSFPKCGTVKVGKEQIRWRYISLA